MTDRIEKALKKLSKKERSVIQTVLIFLKENKLKGLDIKKLKGRDDIFRIRKESLRMILKKDGNVWFLLAIERRSENTYN